MGHFPMLRTLKECGALNEPNKKLIIHYLKIITEKLFITLPSDGSVPNLYIVYTLLGVATARAALIKQVNKMIHDSSARTYTPWVDELLALYKLCEASINTLNEMALCLLRKELQDELGLSKSPEDTGRKETEQGLVQTGTQHLPAPAL